ncbi:SLC13 family permease [Rhodoluna limnophila]|uniref:SLC13 family permease n=1 Tax=Rhodoluna limnophila TaxID=232537 RepID=UPI0011065594|nr:ArsB/NhaD family transporter [Rhodoluna limnophila]
MRSLISPWLASEATNSASFLPAEWLVPASVIIFIVAYVFIATEKINRVAVVAAGAAAMVLIGSTGASQAFYSHETGIDWNVIFLLLGMMIIVGVIHKTGLFEFLAVKAIRLAKGKPRTAFVYILTLVGFASALLDNVTTILLAVPMTFLVAKYLKVNPIPFILGEVFISNIGGAATLIGDPPNIIIASKAGLDFNSFLVHMAPLVLVVMAVIIPMLVLLFRKQLVNSAEDRSSVMELNPAAFITDKALLIKSVSVLTAVIIAFVLHSVLHLEPSMVAMMGAGLLVLISNLKPEQFAKDVEWGTLVFFAGLFIMVGALVNVGALGYVADYIAGVVGTDGALAAGAVVVVSAVVSGIVDNIPYVASMTPVIHQLNESIGTVNDGLWWALAFGADFGGNMTIVGASANVVAVGLAHASGYKISFWQFAKYGVPVTVVSTAMALPYVLIRYF